MHKEGKGPTLPVKPTSEPSPSEGRAEPQEELGGWQFVSFCWHVGTFLLELHCSQLILNVFEIHPGYSFDDYLKD